MTIENLECGLIGLSLGMVLAFMIGLFGEWKLKRYEFNKGKHV